MLAAAIVPLAAGILSGGAAPAAALPTAGAAVAFLVARAARGRRRAVASALALGLLAGAAGGARARLPPPPDQLAYRAPRALAAVEGTIVASARRGARRVLALRVARVRSREGRRPARGLLAVTIAHPRRAWPVGARVRVTARLRAPRSFGNPGGYDYEGALARRGIRITAFLWDDAGVTLLAPPPRASAVARVRARAWAALRAVPDARARGFLATVLLGEPGALDPVTRHTLARTGLAHVASVSGFHVAVVAGAALVGAGWTVRRIPWMLARGDAGKLVAVSGLPLVLAYGALAGGRVPATRAILMYGALLAARLGDRPPDALRALAAVAIVLALGTPDVAADLSFQLSFVSVAAIVLALRGAPPPACDGRARRLARAWLLGPARVTLAATLATAPLVAWHFQQVSLVAPLANVLALPLLGPATLLPGLAAVPLTAVAPGLAAGLLGVAGAAAGAGLALAEALAALPAAAVATPLPSPLELALCYAALALPLVPAQARRRGAAVVRPRRILALALVALAAGDAGYWWYERAWSARLRVTFLSVGQGDAAVAELPGGAVMVIDGGGLPGDFDPGERIVAPFLRARKIRRVDVVVLSHPERDHYGGLAYLVEHFRPRELWWNGMASDAAGFAGLEAALARAGTRPVVLDAAATPRALGPVRATVLHPPPARAGLGANDASLVLRLVYGEVAVLLPGDVERAGEAALVAAGRPLASAVLKVPHHGSDTSSTTAFLRAVAPRVAVISAGHENRFGFPAPAVLGRLARAGADVWRTDRDGAVRVVTDGRVLAVSGWRGRAARLPAGP